jgi:3-hydroxymyristoyl/3-hydroxydecanoyl-(acyl carrier protein) dehydratase
MALESWHLMTSPGEKAPGSLITEFRIGEDSLWFAGHFPDEPILPGVAILSMVAEMIRHFEGNPQRKTRITGLKRVRFRLPVKPHDTVSMELTCEKADRVTSYRFQACVKEEIACTGVVLCEQADVG